MYNLIEYGKNDRKTTGSLWNYYSDEPNNPPADNYNANPITNFSSFKYKSSITGKTPNNNSNNNNSNNNNNNNNNNNVMENLKIVAPLKHLGGFWKSLKYTIS